MRVKPRRFLLAATGTWLALTGSVSASSHFMQIEQVIGGVNGDTSAQAIQLRLRYPGDIDLQLSRIRAWDADGANPVILIDFAEWSLTTWHRREEGHHSVDQLQSQ